MKDKIPNNVMQRVNTDTTWRLVGCTSGGSDRFWGNTLSVSTKEVIAGTRNRGIANYCVAAVISFLTQSKNIHVRIIGHHTLRVSVCVCVHTCCVALWWTSICLVTGLLPSDCYRYFQFLQRVCYLNGMFHTLSHFDLLKDLGICFKF